MRKSQSHGALGRPKTPVWKETAGPLHERNILLRTPYDAVSDPNCSWTQRPTLPVIDNDHEIQPAPRADAFYGRYGPIWAQLRAKRWLTTAHAVTVVGGAARGAAAAGSTLRANAFERQPYGSGRYAVALAFGAAGNATLRLALPELLARARRGLVDGPPLGGGGSVAARATLLDGVQAVCAVRLLAAGLVEVDVPLRADGCAVVSVEVT